MKLRVSKITDYPGTQIRTIRIGLEEPMDFKPGQFVLISLIVNEKICRRAYSICSSPTEKKFIELTFNLHEQGQMTPELFKLQENDPIEVKGPFGIFTFDEEKEKDVVLIAGGTGVTPMRSLVRYCTDKKLDTKIHLFYGARNPGFLVFADEFRELFNRNPNLKIYFTVDDTSCQEFDGRVGRLDIGFVKEFVPNLPEHTYYICGPNVMINNMMHDLEENGAAHANIKIDKW